jgi:hypothetical protein
MIFEGSSARNKLYHSQIRLGSSLSPFIYYKLSTPLLAHRVHQYRLAHCLAGNVTLIEGGRNGLQRCPFRLPRSRNPTH